MNNEEIFKEFKALLSRRELVKAIEYLYALNISIKKKRLLLAMYSNSSSYISRTEGDGEGLSQMTKHYCKWLTKDQVKVIAEGFTGFDCKVMDQPLKSSRTLHVYCDTRNSALSSNKLEFLEFFLRGLYQITDFQLIASK